MTRMTFGVAIYSSNTERCQSPSDWHVGSLIEMPFTLKKRKEIHMNSIVYIVGAVVIVVVILKVLGLF